MKRSCREVGIALECKKFSDKRTVDTERHGMGGFFNYCFGSSDPMVQQLN